MLELKRKLPDFQIVFYCLFIGFCALLPFQFALNPKPGYDLAIVRVAIPLLFLGLLLIQKTFSYKNKTTCLIISFLILATFSLYFSQNIFWSMRKLLFLFSIVPIYLVALWVFKKKTYQRQTLTVLIIGATVLACLAIAQFFAQFIFGINPVYNFLARYIAPFFLGNSFSQAVLAYPSWLVNSQGTTYMRAVANFPDPHMLAYYFAMLLPWSVALAVTSPKKYSWFLLSAILLFVADICTFTRGSYLSLIAGALIIIPLVSRKTIFKIITGVVLILALYAIVPDSPVVNRLASSFNVQEGSNQGRISNWQEALIIIKDHPLGVGIGMYSLAVDPKADYREPIYAHDLYLDIAAELGLPAAILFIVLIALTFKNFWLASKENTMFIAGISSITIFAIHSLVETPLYSVHILTLFLIVVALSASIKNYDTV